MCIIYIHLWSYGFIYIHLWSYGSSINRNHMGEVRWDHRTLPNKQYHYSVYTWGAAKQTWKAPPNCLDFQKYSQTFFGCLEVSKCWVWGFPTETYEPIIYTYTYICNIYIYDINTFIKLHHLCHALTPVFHSSAWCWNMQIGSRLWLICLYYYVQCVDICHNIKHITKHKENRMMWKNAGLLWWCPSPQETHSEMIAFPNGFLPKVDYLGRKENRFKFQFLHSNTTRHWAISIYGTTVEFSR